jgi:hypothetical protein
MVMKRIDLVIKITLAGVWAGNLSAQGMSFAYTFGKSQDEYGYGIMEVSGGYVVVGEALLGGGGKRDTVALKIGTDGSFVWYKTYGKNDNDILRFPFIAHDGNYIHFGYTQTNVGRRPISVKTQTNGNLIWVKSYSIVGEFLDVIKETNGFAAVGYDFLGRGIFVRLNNLLPRYPIWGLSGWEWGIRVGWSEEQRRLGFEGGWERGCYLVKNLRWYER